MSVMSIIYAHCSLKMAFFPGNGFPSCSFDVSAITPQSISSDIIEQFQLKSISDVH